MTFFAESEVLEAIAQYDFTARSSREVSHDDDDSDDTNGDLVQGELHEGGQYHPVQPGQLRLVAGLCGRQRGAHPRQIRPHQDQVSLETMTSLIMTVPDCRGEDDPRDSMSSMSETSSGEPRRRISSQSDTLRSTRSGGSGDVTALSSPRVSRTSGAHAHSVSAPPETPPIVRATPTRHSVTGGGPPVATVISVTASSPPPGSSVVRSVSRDSVEQDSGHPESEPVTTASERGNSRWVIQASLERHLYTLSKSSLFQIPL